MTLRALPLFCAVLLVANACGYYAAPNAAAAAARCRPAVMKGKGSRGMPGKGATAAGTGGGFTKNSKKKMQQRDFARSEWTLVADKGELGDEVGSGLAVEAGQSPMGQNYIWALMRAGPPEGEEPNVYATDGSCVACQFPMSKAVLTNEDGLELLDCKTCGSQWNLKDGSVHKWLPGDGLSQIAMKAINKDKEPKPVNLLTTRVSQSGRIYIRLPDGTLKIDKTAAERAAELASGEGLKEVAKNVQTLSEKVAAAQQKAK